MFVSGGGSWQRATRVNEATTRGHRGFTMKSVLGPPVGSIGAAGPPSLVRYWLDGAFPSAMDRHELSRSRYLSWNSQNCSGQSLFAQSIRASTCRVVAARHAAGWAVCRDRALSREACELWEIIMMRMRIRIVEGCLFGGAGHARPDVGPTSSDPRPKHRDSTS